MTDEELAAPDVRGASLWQNGPASPADQWVYFRSGAWAPGDQHWLVERAGQLYGLLSFLVTVAVLVPLWLLQRPSRAGIAAAVGLLLWGSTQIGGAA